MAGFDNIKVKSPYSIKIIQDLKMEHKPNEHTRLYLKGIVDEAVNFKSAINATYDDEIHIYQIGEKENKTIFKGLMAEVKTTNVNGVYYIEVEGLSGSFKLDIKKKSRSFQDVTLEYPQLIKEIIKDCPGSLFINTVGDGVKIGEPVIQYKETDWELIKRLASRFQSVLICDILENKPRFYFGFPQKESYTIEDDIPYTANKDLIAFKKAGGYEAGYHDTDFFYYEIESLDQYNIGDEIWFRNKRMYVSRITAYMDRGLLKYKYRLSRIKGIRQNEIHNPRLKGISLEGKVLGVKDELVKLHLDIDKEQPKAKAYWYPFAPPTNNVMYCMPQTGTHATLYFPDATGNNAKVLGCVRKNGDSCQKTGNPNIRYWGTEHGSELELSPTAINIVAGCKEPLKLSIDDATGITLTSHKKIVLNALGEISLKTPKRVIFNAPSQILLKKTGALSGFAIENEYHFLGANVLLEGRDRTTFAPYTDDEPKAGKPPSKSPFDWGKLARNVLGGLAVVAVVAAAAVFTVATLGAGAVVIGAVAAGAVIGGTAAVASVAVSDIMRGEVNDFDAYASAAAREATIGAIAGAIFGPLGAAYTLAGKMAVGGANNAMESCIRQTMEGKGINLWTVFLDAGIGAGTAGILDSKYVKAVGNAVNDAAPWIRRGANKIMGALEENANKLASRVQPNLAIEGVPNGFIKHIDNVDNNLNRIEQNEIQKRYNEVTKGTNEVAEEATEKAGREAGKTYTSVEYKGTTKVDGEVKDISRRIYQRNDIDWNQVDPETGLTNLELMKKGRPPYWKDGTKVELHHVIQLEPGPMVELPASLHDDYTKILHGLAENGGSFRNNPALEKQYNNFRSKYWRWRAKQLEE